jgi:hypothetical protein
MISSIKVVTSVISVGTSDKSCGNAEMSAINHAGMIVLLVSELFSDLENVRRDLQRICLARPYFTPTTNRRFVNVYFS